MLYTGYTMTKPERETPTGYEYDIDFYKANPTRYRILSNGAIRDELLGHIVRSQHSPGLYRPEKAAAILADAPETTRKASRAKKIRSIAADEIARALVESGKIPQGSGPSDAIGFAIADTFIRSLEEDTKLRDTVLAQRFGLQVVEPELVADPRGAGVQQVGQTVINISGDVAVQVAQLVQGDEVARVDPDVIEGEFTGDLGPDPIPDELS